MTCRVSRKSSEITRCVSRCDVIIIIIGMQCIEWYVKIGCRNNGSFGDDGSGRCECVFGCQFHVAITGRAAIVFWGGHAHSNAHTLATTMTIIILDICRATKCLWCRDQQQRKRIVQFDILISGHKQIYSQFHDISSSCCCCIFVTKVSCCCCCCVFMTFCVVVVAFLCQKISYCCHLRHFVASAHTHTHTQ